ncbi:MAG: hypothetical protein V2B18_05980 [Pseudomonadota bacterium]|jgi:hypothetical protein
MNRSIRLVVACGLFVVMAATAADAAPLFVATAQNLRGALYLGYGPSPQHASEQALVKCSQDAFIPPSCRVMSVRMDCPPPPPAACYPTKVKKTRPYAKTSY